ncbi:MAG TPA: hypothetical protein VNM72_10100 [Blastocatellia bacterium]|nr:hypothetical protein [Blastocatellia bacterium]
MALHVVAEATARSAQQGDDGGAQTIGWSGLLFMVGRWILLGLLVMMNLLPARGNQGSGVRSGLTGRVPVGELILIGDGEVRINGWRATWGSTVFEGSEIVTTSSVAFVKLMNGAGAIVIEPSSQVKISRRVATPVVRVIRGKVMVRSQEPFELETPDRTIRSMGEELYSVVVSEKRVRVESARPSQTLSVGRVLAMAAPAVAGAALIQAALGSHPAPAIRRATSEEQQRVVIECRTEKLPGLGLRVVGKVHRGFVPVAGAPVIIRVMFRSQLMMPLVSHVLTGTSGPHRGFFQTVQAATQTDLSRGGVVEVVTQVDHELAHNRCLF